MDGDLSCFVLDWPNAGLYSSTIGRSQKRLSCAAPDDRQSLIFTNQIPYTIQAESGMGKTCLEPSSDQTDCVIHTEESVLV
jgi:hypothetical protein